MGSFLYEQRLYVAYFGKGNSKYEGGVYMTLHNGSLFWPTTYDKPVHINPVMQPHYDVIIVGGGMSGVLTAKALVEEGLHVALLEKREVGIGSTSANTGLLQYSNDMQLQALAQQIGEADAARFYHLCYEALDLLAQTAALLPNRADFIRRPSICFASKKGDAKSLKSECEMLVKHGFPVAYWNEHIIRERLPYAAVAALYTENDAEMNPYKFVVSLAERLKTQGLDVFEQTMVNVIENQGEYVLLQNF